MCSFFFCTVITGQGNKSRGSGGSSSRTPSTRVEGSTISSSDPNRKRGMVLPFEPLSIAFNEIRYAIDMPQVSDSLISEQVSCV